MRATDVHVRQNLWNPQLPSLIIRTRLPGFTTTTGQQRSLQPTNCNATAVSSRKLEEFDRDVELLVARSAFPGSLLAGQFEGRRLKI